MVTGALLKKSIKDMKKSLTQFISIFIMANVAVCMLAGLDSVWKTIEVHSQEMYETSNLSDLWIFTINPTEKDMWELESIEGIKKTEKRFTANVTADLRGAPTLKLYTMNEKTTLDKPYIIKGHLTSKKGVVLDINFARANHLKIGDSLTVKINDRKVDLKIEVLALSSEHIFSVKDAATLQPDPEKYGFVLIDEEKLAEAYRGHKMYNQIAVKFSETADEEQIKRKVDNIFGEDLLGIITKKDNRSLNDVEAKVIQFKTMSAVFPFMFFIVTALVTLSTMSRLVEDQRNQIGTLKALGYSKKGIVGHYRSDGVYVGLLGAAVGALAGPNGIGKILINNLRVLYILQSYEVKVNIPNIILGTILIMLCTAGVACYSCLKIQNEMPATLLRNKPPKKGNHIVLEKMPALWNKMKFSQKLIARNTIKNKGRMLMGIFGIMGCSGLIIGAFTLFDTISGIAKNMYEKVYTYDNIIVLDDKTTDKDIYNLHIDGTVQNVQETVRQVVSSEGERRMANVSVLTKESPLFHLEDVKGNLVTVPDEGIVITRKLAEILKVKEGDNLLIKKLDDHYQAVKINQIAYMVSGQGIYISKEYWESLRETYTPTSTYIKWHAKASDLLESDYVENYTSIEEQRIKFNENLRITYVAVIMLIASGGILAFVVLYNLGILNFYERTRDLATLKVLGFYQKEISSLVLMENIFRYFGRNSFR